MKAQPKDGQTELRKIASAYAKTFKSPNGKRVLADLRSRYMDSPINAPGDTEKDVCTKAAKHDVVLTIIQLMESQDGKR